MILFGQRAIVKLCEIIEALVFKQRWLVYLPIYLSIIIGDISHTIHVCYVYPKPRVAYHTWMVCFRPPRLLANSYSEKAIYEKKLLARLHGAGIDVFGQPRMGKPSKKNFNTPLEHTPNNPPATPTMKGIPAYSLLGKV